LGLASLLICGVPSIFDEQPLDECLRSCVSG
jgi:hypothetical protein